MIAYCYRAFPATRQELLCQNIEERYVSKWLGRNMPAWVDWAAVRFAVPAAAFGRSARAQKAKLNELCPIFDFFAASTAGVLLLCCRWHSELKERASRMAASNILKNVMAQVFGHVAAVIEIKATDEQLDMWPPPAGDIAVPVVHGMVHIKPLVDGFPEFKRHVKAH